MNNNKFKLTSRGQYAVMALVELSKSKESKPVSLTDISETANISLSYLEQLIAALRKHGIVKSYRGPGGGYVLAREPKDILIVDILQAAEDSIPAKRSKKLEHKTESCSKTSELWNHIGSLLHRFLKTVSLDDVLKEQIQSHTYYRKILEVLE